MAAKRQGVEVNEAKQIVSPTEKLLRFVASRRFAGGEGSTPFQIIAGSATASRKTLDNLNRVLKSAATEDASSTHSVVWKEDVKACRPSPISSSSSGVEEKESRDEEGGDISSSPEQHTIRSVTVPQEVKHQYIAMEKEAATSPSHVLAAVAKAAAKIKPETALVFLCGEFGKSNAKEKQRTLAAVKAGTSKARRTKGLKQKKMAAAAASRAKAAQSTETISARKACSTLAQYGIEAKVCETRVL